MPFTIRLSTTFDREVERLRVFDQRRITDAIRVQLTESPDVETKNRKQLSSKVRADFKFRPPLWELRVGDYRVLYEVERPAATVLIHAVRRKPADKTTEEILNEAARH